MTVFTSNLGERSSKFFQNIGSSYKIARCHNPEHNFLSSHCTKKRRLFFYNVYMHIQTCSCKSHKSIQREQTNSPVHFWLGVETWVKWPVSRPGCFAQGTRALGTHQIVSTSVLDVQEKRKISFHYWDSNPGSSMLWPYRYTNYGPPIAYHN